MRSEGLLWYRKITYAVSQDNIIDNERKIAGTVSFSFLEKEEP